MNLANVDPAGFGLTGLRVLTNQGYRLRSSRLVLAHQLKLNLRYDFLSYLDRVLLLLTVECSQQSLHVNNTEVSKTGRR